jgi:molecular chaperone GrpE (heat shock protein)
VDFETELAKLLDKEEVPPQDETAELTGVLQYLLNAFNKKQTEYSLQLEEIYDTLKSQDTQVLQASLAAEGQRANHLALTALGLSDNLEHFCAYARQSGTEELRAQAEILWNNSANLLAGCGILRLGNEEEPFDPRIHQVQGAIASALPRERVVQVLQSGYGYLGTVLRKATVLLSRGPEESGTAENTEGCGDYE